MQVVMIYFMGFVNMFARFGRYADLVLGLVIAGLGLWWSSAWMVGTGVFSLAAFAFDLNGWVQRRSIAFAHARVVARRNR